MEQADSKYLRKSATTENKGASTTRLEPIVRALKQDEVGALADLERASWPIGLQASNEMIQRRLDLGHDCIVAEVENTLICAACHVLTSQAPHDSARFPKDFEAFSSLPRTAPVVSSYGYSLCVHPSWRGHAAVFRVLDHLLVTARQAGARYLVGDGRCPSFNGMADGGPDRVRRNEAFRTTIRRWHQTGVRPMDAELIVDPVLRFYRRYLNCQFLHLAPDFIAEDHASGGYRVIFVVNL